jgi:hypothetical protein
MIRRPVAIGVNAGLSENLREDTPGRLSRIIRAPPNPGCFSVLGTALAHYTVLATSTPNAFFQPAPTIEIISTPEPGTLSAGMLAILLLFAAERSTQERPS